VIRAPGAGPCGTVEDAPPWNYRVGRKRGKEIPASVSSRDAIRGVYTIVSSQDHAGNVRNCCEDSGFPLSKRRGGRPVHDEDPRRSRQLLMVGLYRAGRRVRTIWSGFQSPASSTLVGLCDGARRRQRPELTARTVHHAAVRLFADAPVQGPCTSSPDHLRRRDLAEPSIGGFDGSRPKGRDLHSRGGKIPLNNRRVRPLGRTEERAHRRAASLQYHTDLRDDRPDPGGRHIVREKNRGAATTLRTLDGGLTGLGYNGGRTMDAPLRELLGTSAWPRGETVVAPLELSAGVNERPVVGDPGMSDNNGR